MVSDTFIARLPARQSAIAPLAISPRNLPPSLQEGDPQNTQMTMAFPDKSYRSETSD